MSNRPWVGGLFVALGLLTSVSHAEVKAPDLLLDTQFIAPYEAPDAFDSEPKIKAFRELAHERMKALKIAFDEASDACLKAFFVERCVDQKRELYILRTREIRTQLKRAGDSLLEMREAEDKASKQNVKGTKAAPGEVHLLKGAVPEHAPKPFKRLVKDISPTEPPKPLPRLVRDTPKRLSEKEEQENQAIFEAKAAKAHARIAAAQAEAEARRANRIAKREEVEAKLRAREEEQKRFEARQRSEDPTGLMRYLQGE